MKGNFRKGLSPLVAILLLIAITVAAAVVVAGVFFNLSATAGRRPSILIDSVQLVVDPATGNGLFAITIKNTGDVGVNATTLTNEIDLSNVCDGTTASLDINVNIQPRQTQSFTTSLTGCTVGEVYPLTITVKFFDGSTQTLATTVRASLA